MVYFAFVDCDSGDRYKVGPNDLSESFKRGADVPCPLYTTIDHIFEHTASGDLLLTLDVPERARTIAIGESFKSNAIWVLSMRKVDDAVSIDYLLEKGAALNDALGWAAATGKLNLMEYLIEECGANFQADNNYPARIAIANKHWEVVKYLGKKDAPITDSALLKELMRRNEDALIELIIENDELAPDMVDHVIDWAFHKNHMNIIEQLFKNGRIAPRNYQRILKTAASHGQLDLIEFMISTLEWPWFVFGSAFDAAAGKGHANVVKFLIKQGYITDLIKIRAATETAIKNGHLAVVQCIHTHTNISLNPLLVPAVRANRFDIVEYLMTNGADVRWKDNDAMYWAVKEDLDDIVIYLRAHGGGSPHTRRNRSHKLRCAVL
jgi:hypothetical protein